MKGTQRIKCIAILLAALALCGCEKAAVESGLVVLALATPEPTAQVVHLSVEVTPIPSAIPLPEELWSPVPTEEPTATPIATQAPTEQPTDAPTASPKATAKATEKPKATSTPKPKATNTPKPTVAPVGPTVPPAVTPIPTSVPTAAPTSASTAVPTSVPTATPAPTPAPTQNSQQVTVPSGARFTGDEVLLAARVAYFESNKSSEEGLRAVVCVILNRVESSRWPDSVYDVVYQSGQFSVVNGKNFLSATIPDSVIAYANDVLNNGNRGNIGNNVVSFKADSGDTAWGDRTYVGTYGGNAFYA